MDSQASGTRTRALMVYRRVKPPSGLAGNQETRLFVVPDQEQAHSTIYRPMGRLVELISGQSHSYNRAALIEMQDKALAAKAEESAE